jgi:hypothetical protein
MTTTWQVSLRIDFFTRFPWGRPYSDDLRERVVAAIEAGHTRVKVAKDDAVVSCAADRLGRLRVGQF